MANHVVTIRRSHLGIVRHLLVKQALADSTDREVSLDQFYSDENIAAMRRPPQNFHLGRRRPMSVEEMSPRLRQAAVASQYVIDTGGDYFMVLEASSQTGTDFVGFCQVPYAGEVGVDAFGQPATSDVDGYDIVFFASVSEGEDTSVYVLVAGEFAEGARIEISFTNRNVAATAYNTTFFEGLGPVTWFQQVDVAPLSPGGYDGMDAAIYEMPYPFELLASDQIGEGAIGYSNFEDNPVGEIEREPLPYEANYLAGFFTGDGDLYILINGGELNTITEVVPVINGTAYPGGVWDYDAPYTRYHLVDAGFAFSNDTSYEITWEIPEEPDTAEFTMTAGASFTAYGMGYANDEAEPGGPFTGGIIDPDPPLVGGYEIRRFMDTEDPAFQIVLEYSPEGEHNPDEVFTAVHILGIDDELDVTLLVSEVDGFNQGYNGSYSAWFWNGSKLGFVDGNQYTITFTLA